MLIWLKWKHPYNGALLYIKNIFHFLTFQNSKLAKTVAKNSKNMTSFSCFVQSADFLPYVFNGGVSVCLYVCQVFSYSAFPLPGSNPAVRTHFTPTTWHRQQLRVNFDYDEC